MHNRCVCKAKYSVFQFCLLLNFFLFNSGCLKFNKDELKLLNTYKDEEILIFKSLQTGKERIYYLKKLENTLGGLTESHPSFIRHGIISFRCVDSEKNRNIILYIHKDSQNDEIQLFADGFLETYKGGLYFLNSIDTVYINKNKYYNYYKLINSCSFGYLRKDDITCIYWQEDIGVIKFDLVNGDSYVRINM